ncbi:pyridine nucleotide-disulfide oxidoreductase [Bacteroidia bacterium]|nr:pyridine nucleotide-disulfide oxidoreductase [Bacteroidia bacterium]
MKITLLVAFTAISMVCSGRPADLFIEAESFAEKGGWVIDQQFMDQMGSPYLMAHGMGVPVEKASTRVTFPKAGTYYVYVRTYNWTSPWKNAEGPGKFKLSVNGKQLSAVLGVKGSEWMWQEAGKVSIKNEQATLALHDLTGFNGRCDAIYFTTEQGAIPPSDVNALEAFRRKALQLPDTPPTAGTYDLVVVGGGIAGICAAISAARLGCKVALINDRPVLGGNNSSEIRVHLGGRIETAPYKELGNLLKEFGPTRGGNAQPAAHYEDAQKAEAVAKEKNITLFSNYHVSGVEMDGQKIRAVIAKHIENGTEQRFCAPLFADCTGDGTVGYLAGADYRMGRESRSEFGETTAPEKADKLTMGASVQWYSVDNGSSSGFPLFNYGVTFNDKSCEKVTMGEWTWETGMNVDQIKDFERIRDYGLMVVYSNWSYLKNNLKENSPFRNLKLGWVAYISGKRESRRLMGDYVMKEDDLRKNVAHEDGTASTTWSIDLHYPDPKNTENFPGAEFKSIARHINIYPYPIPYRCLYSRNIDNLFMAGRNISVTHVALGTVRVMRTTGMMGEVVGMAVSLCKQHGVRPRGVYQSHLDELKALMQEGVGRKGLPNNQPNNQHYNEGGTLTKPPEIKN